MNRKLIRTTLAEVKGRSNDVPQQKDRAGGEASGTRPAGGAHRGGERAAGHSSSTGAATAPAASQGRKRVPVAETNAEIFYYKKQMDAHTQMVIVLQDGEEIEGTIEWYDRNALKVNRKGEPNILLLKHNIKYMYKAEDRNGGETND